jgi:hypothetical protein
MADHFRLVERKIPPERSVNNLSKTIADQKVDNFPVNRANLSLWFLVSLTYGGYFFPLILAHF